MPILRILPGAQRGASIPVTEPVVIGRSRGAGLTFEERTLSRLPPAWNRPAARGGSST